MMSWGPLAFVPLKVGDELSDGDLLRHLLVEVLAVEHHGLQDGQRALEHGSVHGRLADVAGNLHESAEIVTARTAEQQCINSTGGPVKGICSVGD